MDDSHSALTSLPLPAARPPRWRCGGTGSGRFKWCTRPGSNHEFDELGAAYFRSQGFDAAVTKATGIPDDPARVEPQRIIDWVEHHVQDGAEAVFLAGNGFRAAGVVEELELRTGRLVLEANQALLWGILSATGKGWDVTGHGRLLRANTATT